MKIAYIAAGAAGMYCGTCIHDNTLAAALQRKGHEVALIPTYTPIRTDEADVSIERVFTVELMYISSRSRHYSAIPLGCLIGYSIPLHC